MEDRIVVIVLTAVFVLMAGTSHLHVNGQGVAITAAAPIVSGR